MPRLLTKVNVEVALTSGEKEKVLFLGILGVLSLGKGYHTVLHAYSREMEHETRF